MKLVVLHEDGFAQATAFADVIEEHLKAKGLPVHRAYHDEVSINHGELPCAAIRINSSGKMSLKFWPWHPGVHIDRELTIYDPDSLAKLDGFIDEFYTQILKT